MCVGGGGGGGGVRENVNQELVIVKMRKESRGGGSGPGWGVRLDVNKKLRVKLL